MESRNSESSFHGGSVDYQNFKSKLATIANGVESSLPSLANELLSVNLITNYEHDVAINGTDSLLTKATNMLRSVLTKIKTDSPSGSIEDSCYCKFVNALRASGLSHVADQLQPNSRKGSKTSEGALSVTSGLASLTLVSERDGPQSDSVLMDRRASGGSVSQASDRFPSSWQAQPQKFSNADTSFDMGERSYGIHIDEQVLIPGKLPTVNSAHYKSQTQIPSTSQQQFCFSSQPPVMPNSAPAGLHSEDMFCDMCDMHEDEAAHYKKVVTNWDDEKASFHGLLDRCKTKCKQQMIEIRQLRQKQKKCDELITTLTHKLQEMKAVNQQYKELVAKGAKEDKIDRELLQLFEAIDFSYT